MWLMRPEYPQKSFMLYAEVIRVRTEYAATDGRTECAMLHETTCSEACLPVRTERAQRRGARSREEPCSGRNPAFAAYFHSEKRSKRKSQRK